MKQTKRIKALLEKKSGIRLDIGCGTDKQPGFVGMDIRKLKGVDIIHDCEQFPWPLPDESVVVAIAIHLVEHINPHKGIFLKFMNEVWRILKPQGEFVIVVPYGLNEGFVRDPSHCNPCNENTWSYFDPLEERFKGQLYEEYKPKPWKIKKLNWSLDGVMDVVLIKRKEGNYEKK